MVTDTVKADYCLEVNYRKESEKPSRVFKAVSDLIEAFQEIDNDLVKTIDVNIETVILLEDVQAGSIRVWLRNSLKLIPDDAAYNLDWKPIVGQYLVRAKKFMVNFLEKKTTISNAQEIVPLQNDIYSLAETTKVRWLPVYNKIQPKQLLDGLQRISAGLANLTEGDSASYIIPDEPRAEFNLTFSIAPESIEELLAKDTLSSENEMILKIKKPDYLGESMWDFRHGKGTISASVVDAEWLEKFQSRKVTVQPQDSIRAIVKIINKYDEDGELIATHYDILKVLEVIQALNHEQPSMLSDKDSGDGKENHIDQK